MNDKSPTELFVFQDPSTLDASSLTLDTLPASSVPSASKEEIDAMMNSNIELGEIGTITLTKDIFAVVEQGDNTQPSSTPTPKTTSLQPLAEALKMTAGISPQNKEVVAKARTIESGIRDIKKRIDNQQALTEKVDQALPLSLKEGLDKAEKATQDSMESTALHLQKQGNLTISSNNGIRLTSMEGVNISGSSTYIGTGTVTMNNQVTTISSETIVNMSDTTIARVNGSKFTHVEDSNQLSTRNDITRATETSQTISTRVFSHGAELHSATGETMQATAGSGGHTTHATGGINNFTEAGVVTLAKDHITMGAGSPAAPPTIEPASLKDAKDIAGTIENIIPDSSFIRMIANGESAGITSVTSGSTSTVSKGSSMNMSSNSYITATTSAVQVAGQQLMNGVTGMFGQTKSHVYQQGKIIISGRFVHGFPSINTDLIEFPTVPALPPKPNGYSVQDLKKCIPKKDKKDKKSTDGVILDNPGTDIPKDKKKKEDAEALSVLGINPEAIQEQAGSLTNREGLANTTPGISATAQDQANNASATAEVSPSLGSSINDMSLAVGGAGGPLGIYPDRYSNKEVKPTSSSSIPDILTEDNLLTLTAKGNKFRELIEDIKNGCKLSNLDLNVCSLFDTYRSFFLDELHQDTLKVLYNRLIKEEKDEAPLDLILSNIKLEDSILYGEVINKGGFTLIELFIKAYIEDFGVIASSLAAGPLSTMQSIAAVAKDATGYLGLGQKALSTMGINISIPGIGSIGSIVSRGLGLAALTESIATQEGPLDLGEVLSIGSKAVKELGIPLPGNVSSALSNAGSIADYLRANPNPELLDLIRQTAVKNLVEDILGSDPLEDILGPDYLNAIEPIKEIICQLKSSEPIDKDALTQRLQETLQVLGLNNISSKITSIYSRINPILDVIESGDIDLQDPRLASAIDAFLGTDIASKLLKGYNEVKSIIGNITALSSIPKLLEMMNKQDVPLLAQMTLMLSCLDVFNRLKQIAGSVDSIIDNASDLFKSNSSNNPKVEEALSRVKARSSLKKQASINITTPLPIPIRKQIDLSLSLAMNTFTKDMVIEIDDKNEKYILIPSTLVIGLIDNVMERDIRFYPDRVSTPIKIVIDGGEPILTSLDIKEIWKGSQMIWTNPYPNLQPINIDDRLLSIDDKLPLSNNDEFNSKAAYIYENLPYLIQYIRVLEKASIEDIERLAIVGISSSTIDELIVTKSITQLPASTSSCYVIPKLDIEESEVNLLSITKGVINFSISNLATNTGIGSIIQLCARTFIRSNNGNLLEVFQDDRQYTPCVLNYSILSYNQESNEGLARIIGPSSFLVLEDNSGVLYQYSIEDVGDKIIPKVHRLNLMA
jgi:hypothetical protein